MSYNKEEVKEYIEPEDICTLLEFFNAEPQIYNDHIVARTICHNADSSQASHKLYYYFEQKLFKCFTQCEDAFDIFELVQKVTDVNDLNKAVFWVVNFFNLTHKVEDESVDYNSEDWKIFNRYDKINSFELPENKELDYKIYSSGMLEFYPQPEIVSWTKEGIKKEVCDYMGIHYDPVCGNILIPHKNEYGDLIGIRQRTLIQENEKYGKYKPWSPHPKILYNHPLAFNLYGLDIAKENIQKAKMAIVFESEKSVLQYIGYFGLKNDIAVAVCGNSLSKYQFNLLQKYGATEVVIAFDRDFEDDDLVAQEKVEKKLQKVYNKYNAYANISFLYDAQRDKLGYKFSPIDAGKETFLYLFRNRVIL